MHRPYKRFQHQTTWKYRTVLFVSCSISGEPIARVIGPLLPIFALQTAGLLLITFVPAISLAIPRFFGL